MIKFRPASSHAEDDSATVGRPMSVSRFEAASQVTAGKGWFGPQWHLRWWLA